MASDLILDSVRKKLNDEKIKLWLPPYTIEGKDQGCYPQDMLERFSKDLRLSEEKVLEHLEQLRYHALEKLAARQKFEATGMAFLKLKVLGKIQDRFPSSLTLEVSLTISGKELFQLVADEVAVPIEALKLISQGKVMKSQASLKDQNIRNNSSVLVMVLAEKENVHEKKLQELNQMKRDAELLTDMDSDDVGQSYNLQIADQNGKVLRLPPQERKSLAIAMTLHEKSRTAMKQKKYEEALPILLEADSEFRQCTANILDLVDNYALLNLDIVWCYLCLRSMNHLPDAERRLKVCQTCFDKSYGPNLERLQALKGDKTKEMVLFTRLHLMQGIVAYHQGNLQRARTLLTEAKLQLNMLKVDDDKLSQVMGMGYSSTEARLALRSSAGNIEGAVNYIITRREEKEAIKKRNEEERKRNVEQKMLGKTLKGDWLNPDFHKSLMNMGFSFAEAQVALQHSENNISLAVQILQEQRHLLNLDFDDDDAVAKLVSLGFNASEAKNALQKCQGHLENALTSLFTKEHVVNDNSPDDNPSTSTKKLKESRQLKEEAKKAVSRLAEEIPEDEEDHLDLSMTEEELFLAEYLALMDSVQATTNI